MKALTHFLIIVCRSKELTQKYVNDIIPSKCKGFPHFTTLIYKSGFSEYALQKGRNTGGRKNYGRNHYCEPWRIRERDQTIRLDDLRRTAERRCLHLDAARRTGRYS